MNNNRQASNPSSKTAALSASLPGATPKPALSASRRVVHSSSARRSKIRQMQSAASKDAEPWHKSGVKETAGRVSPAPYGRRKKEEMKKKDPVSAIACIQCSIASTSRSATSSFFAQNLRSPSHSAMAARLLGNHSSHAHSCVLPRLPEDFVPKSGQIDRCSKWHFAVANCHCFYTLRATRLDSKTEALSQLGICRCCCFSEQCARAGAFWPCNRIHRNGG